MVRCKVKPDHIDSLNEKRKNTAGPSVPFSNKVELEAIIDDSLSLQDSFNKSKNAVINKPKKSFYRFPKKTQEGNLYKGFFKNCITAIKITSESQLKDTSYENYLFGEISLSLIDYNCDEEACNLWLFLNEGCDRSLLYFNVYNPADITTKSYGIEKYFYVSEELNINLWKALGIKSRFELVPKLELNLLTIKVYLLNSAVYNVSWPSEVHYGTPYHLKSTAFVAQHFFGTKIPIFDESDITSNFDPVNLYKILKNFHKGKTYSDASVQHPGLIPKLRPYQVAAVQWMLYQETYPNEELSDKLHSLFLELTTDDGKVLYYNSYGGFFVKDKPSCLKPCPGGILADEMGLGKTVEILACILNNPRKIIVTDSVCNKGINSSIDIMKPNETNIHKPVILENSESKISMDEENCHTSNFSLLNEFAIRDNNINQVKQDSEQLATDSIVTPTTDKFNDSCITPEIKKENNLDSFEYDHDNEVLIGKIDIEEEEINSENTLEAHVSQIKRKRTVRFSSAVSSSDEDFIPSSQRSTSFVSKVKKKSPRISRLTSLSDDDEDFVPGSHHLNNHVSKFKPKRFDKSSRLPVLTSDDDDVDFIPHSECSKGHVSKFKRKKSIRIGNVSSSDDEYDADFLPHSESLTSTSKVDISFDSEITECPVRYTIEKVILDKGWNSILTDYKKKGSYKEFKKFLKKRKTDPYYLMTLRERLNMQYMSSLSSYSATYALSPGSTIKDFFATKVKQKSYFECVCGDDYKLTDKLTKIQCSVCKLFQHAECVHYNGDADDYICPHCWSTNSPVISRATLIISPSSICYQWDEEIKKHISQKSLDVFIYDGVAVHGYLQPRTLANYDMVITNYEVLRRELNYIDLPHSNSEAGRRFRHPKRFMAIPSPLPCIDWWRVCLDEAQMVESITSKTAEMCSRLKCQIKWCITGTPIQKSVKDLQGLLQFLEVDPYCVLQWWQRCLYFPYCKGNTKALHDIIGKHMWRTSKVDVLEQLGIPGITEKIHWLCFTPVEEHFYKRLHTKYSNDLFAKITKYPNKSLPLSSLDRKALSSLLQPLLKLRQACDHPQIVKGIFVQLNKQTLTMEELLENLIKKTKLEAEEAHRVIISSLNGLAALHVIKNEFKEAVATYREILRAVAEEGENLKTDLLQKIHTIHNLAELLDDHKDTISDRTLRDDNLRNEANTLKEQYLRKYPEKINLNKSDCVQLTQSILDLFQGNDYNNDWWLEALEAVDQEFVQEVRDELLASYSRFQEHRCILFHVESRVQLMRLLKVELKKLESERLDMIKGTKVLWEDFDHESLLNGAIDCHLRPIDNNAPKCILCVKHELFENLEQTLFFVKDEKLTRNTDTSKEINEKIETLESLRKGNWGLSEIERILKFLQTKSLGRIDIQVDAQTHLQILQLMKKEFKLYRIWWRSVYDYISALDEVNMATLRYRLRFPGEEIDATKKKKNDLEKQNETPTYVIDECELPQLELKLKSDKIIAQNEMKAKLGQMLYLNNLKKSDLGGKGRCNPEPCPICQVKLGEKWSVLNCGHSFCMDCLSFYLKDIVNYIKCAMCRQSTLAREISYIDTRVTEFEESIKVQGSLSTKIEGIVRTVLGIKADEPDAKVLIFSTWTEVLDVVADGFTQNGITFRMLSSVKFQINLKAFRHKQEITALLIPLSFGANGLNLVEAHHIIMVEPVLNHGTEVQAIGRIHRIGQTKTTFVHRFIVRATIEERIYKILNLKTNTDDDGLSTIESLQELFGQVSNAEIVS